MDPSHPLGGPDGIKDAVCVSNDKRWVMAVYFTRQPVEFKDVENKFKDDARGIAQNAAQGLVFFTNNKLTLSEREVLAASIGGVGYSADIYHLERIRLLLDDPRGYGTRFRFLGIPMSESEQASFFEVYNQSVLARLDEVQQSQREHSERLASIESMMQKLTADRVDMRAVLPERAAEARPSAVEPPPEPAEQEPQTTSQSRARVTSSEEGGAS